MASKKKFQGSKSEFIRTCSTDASAAEVVEAAKAVGVILTPGLVYNVRHAMRAPEEAPEAPQALVKVPSGKPVVTLSEEAMVSQLLSLTASDVAEELTKLEEAVAEGMSLSYALARAFTMGAQYVTRK
jgi:hypothetical protein